MRIAVIGGGLCGLTCAIRLSRQDFGVDLFEAAPSPGGRTRSFFDPVVNQWVDNGPHLLIGAYRHTRELLDEAGASGDIHWQPSLELPLWDPARGHFHFAPEPLLPLPFALPWACLRLPGHGVRSLTALFRLGAAGGKRVDSHLSVHQWLHTLRIPGELVRDLLSPLCLGIMNEAIESANAKSFARVLKEAFASHESARLGWFTRPLSQALIEPLVRLSEHGGVRIHTPDRVRHLHIESQSITVETAQHAYQFDAAVLALPARSRNHLLGIDADVKTQPITNIHLWLDGAKPLPGALIGGIGTSGQWFFDISQQMQTKTEDSRRHICAVISAGGDALPRRKLLADICLELQSVMGSGRPVFPVHHRIVRERHATTTVHPMPAAASLPKHVVDASEYPVAGDLPATIEVAVQRGEMAAKLCRLRLNA